MAALDSFYSTLTGGTTAYTINAGDWSYIGATVTYGEPDPPKQKAAESALEWLERRVNELRVSL